MGFVDNDSGSETESNALGPENDEEAIFANGKESPVLQHHTSHGTFSPSHLRTPTMKHSDLLNVTRLRKKGITESEEIWEELEDDTLAELPSFLRRRSSAQQSPVARPIAQENPPSEAPTESTSLLRSTTGRSYRDTKRRHSGTTHEAEERERERRSVSSQEALGGWWKMKKWFRGFHGSGKVKGSGHGNGDGV